MMFLNVDCFAMTKKMHDLLHKGCLSFVRVAFHPERCSDSLRRVELEKIEAYTKPYCHRSF